MKLLLSNFHFNGDTERLIIHGLECSNLLVQQYEQYHVKVLLNSLHLNDHTLDFYTQIQS